jgi:hypothetical protein
VQTGLSSGEGYLDGTILGEDGQCWEEMLSLYFKYLIIKGQAYLDPTPKSKQLQL